MSSLNVYINESTNFPENYLIEKNLKSDFYFKITREKSNADILFIRLGKKLDKYEINKYKNLKFICTSTTGLTHLDLDYIFKKGIRLISLAGESHFLSNIKTTADLALTLILMAQSLTLDAAYHVKKGLFNRNQFFRIGFQGNPIGILGLGRLGEMVSNYLLNLGFTVFFYDKKSIIYDDKRLVKCDSINQLFNSCKIVSIHIDYCLENKSLINRDLLNLNPPYRIINTSRAEIFDYDEINHCIKNNLLQQYFTDVLKEEPFESNESVKCSKLWKMQRYYGMEKIFITPHIGGACWDSLYKCELFLIDKLINELENN